MPSQNRFALHRRLQLRLRIVTWAFATRECLEANWKSISAHTLQIVATARVQARGSKRFGLRLGFRNRSRSLAAPQLVSNEAQKRRDSRLLVAAQMSAALLTTFCTYMPHSQHFLLVLGETWPSRPKTRSR